MSEGLCGTRGRNTDAFYAESSDKIDVKPAALSVNPIPQSRTVSSAPKSEESMSVNLNLSHGTTGTVSNLIATPIAIFVSHLLSLGHTGQELAEIVRLAEAAFRNPSRTGISVENQREK